MCRVGWGAAVPMVPRCVLVGACHQFGLVVVLGSSAVAQTSHEGAAEGTEDLVHKDCVSCFGSRLSADGLQQLPAHLLDCEYGAQVCRNGGVRRSLVLRAGLPLLSAVQWNLHVAVQSLVCGQRR